MPKKIKLMKKIKVLKVGIIRGGKPVEIGDVIDAGGAELEAWLHFGQVELVKANKAILPESAADVKAAELLHQQEELRYYARKSELVGLNRKEQEASAKLLKIEPKGLKEDELVQAILDEEFEAKD